MANRIFPATIFLLTALLPAPPGQADTTLRLAGSRDAANAVIQVKGNRVRLAPATRPVYVIYDKTRNLAVYVDTYRKTYTEIDQASLDRYTGMVSAMRGQFQAQLQLLPPAQRAMLEERMGNLAGIPEGGLPDLDKLHTVARGKRIVGGFHCQLHQILEEKQVVGDICLSSAAEAGVSPDDFATLTAMMDFLRHAASTARQLTGGLTESTRLLFSGLQGVPVAARDYQNRQQFIVAGVSRQPLNSDLFNGYQGYRRQDLMEAIAAGQ
jgi:hypothetical protein